MADFEVHVASGATLTPWLDPGTGSQPSRVRPHPGLPQLYWQARVGLLVELRAKVAGVEAPLDAALAGRLFAACMVESPWGSVSLVSPVGRSSVQRFTPVVAGHHTIRIRRHNGGVVIVHLDAVP